MAAPTLMCSLSFCFATPATARATELVGTSRIMSTPSRSYHCAAMPAPRSGLFWWSALMTSTVKPWAANSSTAIFVRGDRGDAAGVAVGAGLVVQHADPDRVGFRARGRGGRAAPQPSRRPCRAGCGGRSPSSSSGVAGGLGQALRGGSCRRCPGGRPAPAGWSPAACSSPTDRLLSDGLLDLEQVGGGELAAVRADDAVAEAVVVGRHRLHAGDRGGAIEPSPGRRPWRWQRFR